jgi:IQ calmodulin-binding motif
VQLNSKYSVCFPVRVSEVRGFLVRRNNEARRQSAIVIQSYIRGHLQRVAYRKLTEETEQRRKMLLITTGLCLLRCMLSLSQMRITSIRSLLILDLLFLLQ